MVEKAQRCISYLLQRNKLVRNLGAEGILTENQTNDWLSNTESH